MSGAYTVKKVTSPDWAEIEAVELAHQPWLVPCDIAAKAQLCHDGENLYVRMEASEKNIRATLTGALDQVCNDSCLEFFFAPVEGDDRYMNVEFSSTGCLFLGVGTNRYNIVRLLPQGDPFQAAPALTAEGWEIIYQIPVSFIRQFFPDFAVESGKIIRANFYKCGDLTVQEHYFSWNPVTSVNPDFHRSCDFGQLVLK